MSKAAGADPLLTMDPKTATKIAQELTVLHASVYAMHRSLTQKNIMDLRSFTKTGKEAMDEIFRLTHPHIEERI